MNFARMSSPMNRFLAVFSLIFATTAPQFILAQSAPATVFLDVDAAFLKDMNVAFVARDRISRAGSVDQMFFLGTNPAGYPAVDIVGYSGGFVGSSSYDFSLEYSASNQTYSFGLTNGSVSGNATFRPNGANSTIKYDASLKDLDYNIIHVYGVSTSSGSSMSFSDLVFLPGANLVTSGLLETSGVASASGNQYYDQWLAAPTGVNLADYDWAMKARVQLNTTTNPSSGEGIKFEISTKKGIFQNSVVIPEPSSILLSLASVLAIVARRKRN